MWSVLNQMVKVGSNQLKCYNNISCYGIRRKCLTHLNHNLLRTQTVAQPDDKVSLNPEMQDAPYILTKDQQDYVAEGVDGGIEKLHALTLELYIKRGKGDLLPENISLENLRILLTLSQQRRKNHLRYLYGLEALKKSRMAEQMTKEKPPRPPSTSEYPWLDNRVHGNCLFNRIRKQDQNQIYHSNALWGLLFGQNVIIDCSYSEHMDDIAVKKTALQILKCYYSTRVNRRPFSLHICNLDFNSRLMFHLQKNHPGFENNVCMGIHPESYLELFEREKLVYLSPHSTNVLKYNPKDTYILGGFVDTTNPLKLSNKKAAMESIRHASFPLDRYVKWKSGSKSLCIHHSFDILQDVKNTGDWLKALQTHIPSRKL